MIRVTVLLLWLPRGHSMPRVPSAHTTYEKQKLFDKGRRGILFYWLAIRLIG